MAEPEKPARKPQRTKEEIAAALRERILTNKLKQKQRLRGENALSEEFGVKRHVIRDALDLLRGENLIHTRRGAGSFVGSRPIHRLVIDWHDGRLARVDEPAPSFDRAWFSRQGAATVDDAKLIEVDIGAPVDRCGFVDVVDGQPMVVSTSLLPAHLVDLAQLGEPVPKDLAIGQFAFVGRAVTVDGPPRIKPWELTANEAKALGIPKSARVYVIITRVLVDTGEERPVRAAVRVVPHPDLVEVELPPDPTMTLRPAESGRNGSLGR